MAEWWVAVGAVGHDSHDAARNGGARPARGKDVEFRPMKGPPRVTLTFRSATPLGRRVVFIPYARSIDVLVSDLRTRAGLDRYSTPAV